MMQPLCDKGDDVLLSLPPPSNYLIHIFALPEFHTTSLCSKLDNVINLQTDLSAKQLSNDVQTHKQKIYRECQAE